MSKARAVFLLVVVGVLALAVFMMSGNSKPQVRKASNSFLIYPYLQLGSDAQGTKDGALLLRWADVEPIGEWVVETKGGTGEWAPQKPANVYPVSNSLMPPYSILETTIRPPINSTEIAYRLRKDGQICFDSKVKSIIPGQSKYRFAVMGDCGSPTTAQKAIAFRLQQEQPDMLFIPGDITYSTGRQIEYLHHFFPVYNADVATPLTGGPLMRSVLFVAAPGNHDIWMAGNAQAFNLDTFEDGLAYFLYWKQPLNGPVTSAAAGGTALIAGAPERIDGFKRVVGQAFPKMANFSYDFGNSHWLVLDADPYMDWSNPQLRQWVENDLAASTATWKFVGFHQAPYTTGPAHYTEQQMRVLSDLFQKYSVDVVFAGHVHNYQRSFPLRYALKPSGSGAYRLRDGTVGGDLTLDKTFNGETDTTPEGPIYIISGAGGAPLYQNGTKPNDPRQPFTDKLFADAHSCTICDIDGTNLSLRQITADGMIIDKLTITKTAPLTTGTSPPPKQTKSPKKDRVPATNRR